MTVRRRRFLRDALKNRLDDELLNSDARRRNSTRASVADPSNDGARRNFSENRSEDELSNSKARRRNSRARASAVNELNDGARRNSVPLESLADDRSRRRRRRSHRSKDKLAKSAEEKLRGRTKRGIERALSSKRGGFHELPEFFPLAGPRRRDLPRRRNAKTHGSLFQFAAKRKEI